MAGLFTEPDPPGRRTGKRRQPTGADRPHACQEPGERTSASGAGRADRGRGPAAGVEFTGRPRARSLLVGARSGKIKSPPRHWKKISEEANIALNLVRGAGPGSARRRTGTRDQRQDGRPHPHPGDQRPGKVPGKFQESSRESSGKAAGELPGSSRESSGKVSGKQRKDHHPEPGGPDGGVAFFASGGPAFNFCRPGREN